VFELLQTVVAWAIRTFGAAVLDWTVRELLSRLEKDSAAGAPSAVSCEPDTTDEPYFWETDEHADRLEDYHPRRERHGESFSG
jgi:hypothetical protein